MIDHPDFVDYAGNTFMTEPSKKERLASTLPLQRTKPVKPPKGLIRSSKTLDLHFDLETVLALAHHACRSLEHRPAMIHYHDRRLWSDPDADYSEREIELSRGRHIDNMLIPPALDLIKDHGIVVWDNAGPNLPQR